MSEATNTLYSDKSMRGQIGRANPQVPAYLDNEPIYCPAPSPSTSSTVHPDPCNNAAKIRRYEENGRRYLAGKPIRISSASLYGPFNKASGWQNPWLSEAPSQHQDYPISLARNADLSTVDRLYRSDAIATRSPAEGREDDEEVTVDVDGHDDSMDYHLPSPQSNTDLRLLESPSKPERHSRIESWAETIEPPCLEKDGFWVPIQDSTNHSCGSGKKRPASTDWLKRRPAKKTKPQASQSAIGTFSPTPIHVEPPKSMSKKISAIAQRSGNRSFEMTTPSSSPEKGPRDSLSPDRRHVAVSIDNDQSEAGDDWSARCTTHRNIREGQSVRESAGNNTDVAPQSLSPKEEWPGNREVDGTSDFQDCTDESFFYRARPTKHAVDPTPTGITTSGLPSHSTQTETPTSTKHQEMVIVPVHESGAASSITDTSSVQPLEEPGVLRSKEQSPTSNKADTSTVVSVAPTDGNQQSSETRTMTELNASASDSGSNGQLGGFASRDQERRSNVLDMTMEDIDVAQTGSPRALSDDDPTLVGDPMETDEPCLVQSPQALPHTTVADANDSIVDDKGESYAHEQISSPQSDVNAADRLHAPPSRSSTSAPRPVSPNQAKGVAIAAPDTKDGDIHKATVGDIHTPLIRPISLVPALAVENTSEIKGVGIELQPDLGLELQARAIAALSYRLPVPADQSPAIRPSQQSPWAPGTIEVGYTECQTVDVSVAGFTVGADSSGVFQPPLPPTNLGYAPNMSPGASPIWSPRTFPETTSHHQSRKCEIEKNGGEVGALQQHVHTPNPRIGRPATPVAGLSVKSFSTFNLDSPEQLRHQPGSSTKRSILSGKRYHTMTSSGKSSRRVSFAPLSQERNGDGSLLLTASSTRATSPPPPQMVDLSEEDVDGKYQRHFDAMNRRATQREPSKLVYERRLLPSSSQQVAQSPSFVAMAEAFRAADAQVTERAEEQSENMQEAYGTMIGGTSSAPQSPWQHDSQAIDDVAAVLGNLDQFLDVWDVDSELERQRVQPVDPASGMRYSQAQV
ncbi:hypothetical protein GGS20DRAFT_553154 [Poronia punctata]|nr:hypothetical protein GGS20DRAFT_553154 [Poronia punctata]